MVLRCVGFYFLLLRMVREALYFETVSCSLKLRFIRKFGEVSMEVSGDGFMLVKFEVYFDGKYWCARGIGVDIFTQGKTLDELFENIKEAVKVHFEELIERGEEVRILVISEIEVPKVAKAASG